MSLLNNFEILHYYYFIYLISKRRRNIEKLNKVGVAKQTGIHRKLELNIYFI